MNMPTIEDVGSTRTWQIDTADGTVELQAKFLGLSTSHRPKHTHDGTDWARAGERCSACRWFEPRIFRQTKGRQQFVLCHTGRSCVPGETDRVRLEYVLTATEVVEALLTRRAGQSFLTVPAARVLAQASEFDDDLYDAYHERMRRVS